MVTIRNTTAFKIIVGGRREVKRVDGSFARDNIISRVTFESIRRRRRGRTRRTRGRGRRRRSRR